MIKPIFKFYKTYFSSFKPLSFGIFCYVAREQDGKWGWGIMHMKTLSHGHKMASDISIPISIFH